MLNWKKKVEAKNMGCGLVCPSKIVMLRDLQQHAIWIPKDLIGKKQDCKRLNHQRCGFEDIPISRYNHTQPQDFSSKKQYGFTPQGTTRTSILPHPTKPPGVKTSFSYLQVTVMLIPQGSQMMSVIGQRFLTGTSLLRVRKFYLEGRYQLTISKQLINNLYGVFHSHGATPKWLVYEGKSHLEMDENWGTPMAQETTISQ